MHPHSVLFLQSEVADPFAYYEAMQQQPVYRDAGSNLVALYSYKACKTALQHPLCHIPPANTANKGLLIEQALQVIDRLPRLNNGAAHSIARFMAGVLLEKKKETNPGAPLQWLLNQHKTMDMLDWTGISRLLPALALLHDFGFEEEEALCIAAQIKHLSKLVAPAKTTEEIAMINAAIQQVYPLVENRLASSSLFSSITETVVAQYGMQVTEILACCTSNIIGLLIQGYDAGRGMLDNTLLQLLSQNQYPPSAGDDYIKKIIVETLRYNPPVHHTRRVAIDDIELEGTLIKKGEILLVVLASANRDPGQFRHPAVFDIHRPNNATHLSFGTGLHQCLANHYAVDMVAAIMYYLFSNYKVVLHDRPPAWEPVMNVRLLKHIYLSLHK